MSMTARCESSKELRSPVLVGQRAELRDRSDSAHAGTVMATGTGYPGYDTLMQKDTAAR